MDGGVVSVFDTYVDVGGVFHFILMNVAVDLEGGLAENFLALWDVHTEEIEFLEDAPHGYLIKVRGYLFDHVVIADRKAFATVQALDQPFYDCLITHGEVAKVPHVIPVFDHGVPIMNHTLIHVLSAGEAWAN